MRRCVVFLGILWPPSPRAYHSRQELVFGTEPGPKACGIFPTPLHLSPKSVTTDSVPLQFLIQISYHQVKIISFQCIASCLSEPPMLLHSAEQRHLLTQPIRFRGKSWPLTLWRQCLAFTPWTTGRAWVTGWDIWLFNDMKGIHFWLLGGTIQ